MDWQTDRNTDKCCNPHCACLPGVNKNENCQVNWKNLQILLYIIGTAQEKIQDKDWLVLHFYTGSGYGQPLHLNTQYSGTSDNKLMKFFQWTISILFNRFLPLNKENLQKKWKKLAVPTPPLFGCSLLCTLTTNFAQFLGSTWESLPFLCTSRLRVLPAELL